MSREKLEEFVCEVFGCENSCFFEGLSLSKKFAGAVKTKVFVCTKCGEKYKITARGYERAQI